ncbi:MAG: cysteine hydrolase [Thermodesulfovibrionales bacterium]|jgi:nicotinamidase-related amidase
MNDTALLLLDLQRDFLESCGRMPISAGNADIIISSANRLVRHAERAGWKQIFIKNEFRKSDWIGNLFRKRAAIEGSVGAEIDPRVVFPTGSSVISKSRPDAFTNPTLDEILKSARIRQTIILGVMAEGCVRATVKGARHRGFSVIVVSDGVASSRDLLKRFALKSIQKAGASVRECSEILKMTPHKPDATSRYCSPSTL